MSYAIPTSSSICTEPPGRRLGVAATLRARSSVRAYRPEAPDRATVHAVLDAARWSPSGSNMQPWKVIVVTGEARTAVCRLARTALAGGAASEDGDYPVYPPLLDDPYLARRSEVAAQRFAVMGIRRDDRAGRETAIASNYDFFGAPVGLFFVTRREFGHSQWAHLGMFMQSVMLAASEFGLGTCAQEAWAILRETLHRHFGLPEEDLIYCGMAMGYADRTAPVNCFRSAREPVENFATFAGF